ncbi:hypothetical protein HYT84_04700 [Candidatus Micrarchaeota archaeon]|nr:hypothetical protein [Candidatus Micrarchaeota archaeon]
MSGNILAMSFKSQAFSIFNIGGGQNLRLNNVVDLFSKVFKKSIAINYNQGDAGKRHFLLDITKSTSTLNYTPTAFEKAIAEEWSDLLDG